MNEARRIYLDNAATTWPKPESVYAAVDEYQRRLGAPAGRGGYDAAIAATRIVQQLRQKLLKFVNAPADMHVAFGCNGTDVLNSAIHGVLRANDHVIASSVDHNSVLRPLETLADRGMVKISYLGTDEAGLLRVDDLRQALRPNTRLVVLPHASNVTGAIQPVDDVSATLKDHSTLLLIDAAQTLGHLPLDLQQTRVDLLASSGHKGLLGPYGTGVLFVTNEIAESMQSLKQGGTGVDSESRTQPETMPDKLEAGSLNMVGLAGLLAGVEYLLEYQSAIREREEQLTYELIAGLSCIEQVRVLGPHDASKQVGVVSFTVAGINLQELATVLDCVHGIQVRAGLQCAPRMHQQLGTYADGGTIRASFGPFNKSSDVAALVKAVHEYVQLNAQTGT